MALPFDHPDEVDAIARVDESDLLRAQTNDEQNVAGRDIPNIEKPSRADGLVCAHGREQNAADYLLWATKFCTAEDIARECDARYVTFADDRARG